MSEYINPPEWALKFLGEHGHAMGQTNGENIIVDGKTYRVQELPELAESLHRGEWIESRNAYLEELLKQLPKNDAPNAEDFDLGDQGQSGG